MLLKKCNAGFCSTTLNNHRFFYLDSNLGTVVRNVDKFGNTCSFIFDKDFMY